MKKLKVFDPNDFPAYLPKLNNLYDDLFADGKGFRAALVQRVAEPLGVSDSAVHLMGQTIEFIHNASLLHDDLIDRSHLRRNKPAAWTKYTPEYAVLAGDYLLARVMVNLSGYGNIQRMELWRGKQSEIQWQVWIFAPTIDDVESCLWMNG